MASWEDSSLDGAPSALLKLMPMHAKSYSQDSETESCRDSQYGTTCEHSTENLGAETSMSSAADSHVKTLAQLEVGSESKDLALAYGAKWRESFAKYDHATRSWRTHQCSLFEGLEKFSEIWPRWGLMLDGECYPREMLVRFTYVKEFGFSHPTPTATDYHGGHWRSRMRAATSNRPAILRMSLLRYWITQFSNKQRTCYPNPTFIEATMGWPIGWTGLAPLGTDKFQQWLGLHGIRSVG